MLAFCGFEIFREYYICERGLILELLLLLLAIFIPLAGALICLIFKNEVLRKITVLLSSAGLAGVAIALAYLLSQHGGSFVFYSEDFPAFLPWVLKIADIALLITLLGIGFKLKKPFVIFLTAVQFIGQIYLEFFSGYKEVAGDILFKLDFLSLVMILVVSIVGPLIVIFALGYMPEHEKHQHMKKSRQPRFFFILLLFLSAMNALVTINDLSWMYFLWEITTLCSFLLISHDKSEISIKNATRALWMNSIGGVAFVSANIIFSKLGTLQISELITDKGLISPLFYIAVAFLCFAGFTKAAQFPFQSWLLGAMVAPTPVSALLHSSTMVKAGVYLIVRFAPAITGTVLGDWVSLVGGFTFVAAAAIAISQRDAKRVLAYSTISNLGLIICCAGIGNWLATTAAILLIMFHAISKGLLFLCVGTIEHGIGSRNIEDMQGLFKRMPFTTTVAVIGMISMLLPPFGVLLTKWMAMESAVNQPILLLVIALGSAFTVAFWAKWLGIILTMSYKKHYNTETIKKSVEFSLAALLTGVLLLAIGLVPLFDYLVKPYLLSINSKVGVPVNEILIIMLFVILLMLVFFILRFSSKFKSKNLRAPYMCGENTEDIRGIEFMGPAESKDEVVVHNYYLDGVFGEGRLTVLTSIISASGILIMFGVVVEKWLIS